MKNRFPFVRTGACLLLAASAFHAQAQTRQAADPQAAVPAPRYQSAFGARPDTAPTTTPDQNWIASNQTVAATNSMALTMKPMAGHASHAGHTGAQAPAPQAADPHAGHAGMYGMSMGKQDSPAMCMPGAGDGAAAGGKMSCCQPSCCCKDKMVKTNKPKETT